MCRGAPPEFTPLGEWLRGAGLHSALRACRAFDQIWLGGALRRWRSAARRARFDRTRGEILRRLILLRGGMRAAIGNAREKMREVLSAGPVGPTPEEGAVYQWESLVAAQQDHHRGRLALLMARNVSAVAASAQALAGQLRRAEAGLRSQVDQFDRDPSAGACKGANPTRVQAERDEIRRLHRSALEELQLLPGLLRLLDCHVLQSHLDLIVAAVLGVHAHLLRPGVLAEVRIVMGKEGGNAAFEPSQEEFMEAMGRSVVESLVSVIKEVPSPSQHPALAPLLHAAAAASSPATSNLVGSSPAATSHQQGFAFVSVESAVAAAVVTAGATAASRAATAGIIHPAAAPSSSTLAAAASARISAIAAANTSAANILVTGGHREGRAVPGHQITMMAVGDATLGQLRRSCDVVVMSSYRKAARVGEQLGELEALFTFTGSWDARAYRARAHTVASLRRDAALLR